MEEKNVEEKLQELNRKYNGMVLKRGNFCFENKKKGIWIEELKVIMVAISYDGMTAAVYAEIDGKKGQVERLKTAYTQYSNIPSLEEMLEERMRTLTELDGMMQESMETVWNKPPVVEYYEFEDAEESSCVTTDWAYGVDEAVIKKAVLKKAKEVSRKKLAELKKLQDMYTLDSKELAG